MAAHGGQVPGLADHIHHIHHIGQGGGLEQADEHIAQHGQGDFQGLGHDDAPHGLKAAHAHRKTGFHLAGWNGQNGSTDGFGEEGRYVDAVSDVDEHFRPPVVGVDAEFLQQYRQAEIDDEHLGDHRRTPHIGHIQLEQPIDGPDVFQPEQGNAES